MGQMHVHRRYILKIKSIFIHSFIYLFNYLTSIPAAPTMPRQSGTMGDDREQVTVAFTLTENLTREGKEGPIRDGGGRGCVN